MEASGELHAPATEPSGKNLGSQCGGGCVGPQSLAGHFAGEKNHLTTSGFETPDRPARSLVSVPTSLHLLDYVLIALILFA